MERYVSLPNTRPEWSNLRVGLKNLAEKRVRGVEEFEAFIESNDPYQVIHPPFNVLRRVLKDADHVSEEFFAESLLPWIAKKALQVEELFQDCNHKLPVRIACGSGRGYQSTIRELVPFLSGSGRS